MAPFIWEMGDLYPSFTSNKSWDYSIYRQSPVKNQPISHKVDNFHVLTNNK